MTDADLTDANLSGAKGFVKSSQNIGTARRRSTWSRQ
jgi:hypothetical protein